MIRLYRINGVKKYVELLTFLCIFAFLMCFFTVIHPMMVFDTDDWGYLYFSRYAIPVWGAWNPTKILPELLYSACSSFAIYMVYPISGDFLGSITVVTAFMISLLVTINVCMIYKLLTKKYEVGYKTALSIVIFWIICHFSIYRISVDNNIYMLQSANINCYYNYVIPNLLGGVLVLWLSFNDMFDEYKMENGYFKRAIFLCVLYLQLFSNLFSSVIVVAFVGSRLVMNLVSDASRKFEIGTYINKNKFKIAYILLWLVVNLFEAFGGRAAMEGESFIVGLRNSLQGMVKWITAMNKSYLGVVCIIILVSIYIFVKEKMADLYLYSLILSLFLAVIYLLLLCGKLNKYYDRPDALYVIYYLFMLIIVIMFSYISIKVPNIKLVFPIVLIYILSTINTIGRTFEESNELNLDSKLCREINEDIMQQIITAAENNTYEIKLYVPKFASEDNFPLATYANQTIPDALYKYRVISHRVIVTEIIPDINKNYILGLDE